jgi:putative hydrolase of the HAD superfamily
MNIRAVILDFGGVICFHPDQARWDRAAAAAGMPVPEFYDAMWAHRLEYDAGRLEPEEYWRAVMGARFKPEMLPLLVRREIELWDNYDQRVLDWTRRLRGAGYRTAILSNLPRVLGEALRATPGFLDPFDHVTFSYELKSVKPEPEIYLDAIRGVGVPAAEALFVDDKIQNIEGARKVGLAAELFTTWEEFEPRMLPRVSPRTPGA